MSDKPNGCPNGPDEHGNWPCDPKGYFGVAECQTCGRIGDWVEIAADTRHARVTLAATVVAERDRLAEQVAEAHAVLDGFEVPRDEPYFKSSYKLVGRIRWLRSSLVISGNQRAEAAEQQVAALREALSDACDVAVWMSGSPTFGPDGEGHQYWVETARPKLHAALDVLAALPSAPDGAE